MHELADCTNAMALMVRAISTRTMGSCSSYVFDHLTLAHCHDGQDANIVDVARYQEADMNLRIIPDA